MDGLAKTFTEEESSIVDRIRYIQASEILEVTFRTGKVYRYFKVSSEVWNQAIKAESFSQFLNTEIKGKYTYKLMN